MPLYFIEKAGSVRRVQTQGQSATLFTFSVLIFLPHLSVVNKKQGQSNKLFFSNGATAPLWARASSLSTFHDHTQTHHTRYDSSGRVISPKQRPLPDNTQHSQDADIHAPGEIRTRNPSKPTAADPRLRQRCHGDQQVTCKMCIHTDNITRKCSRSRVLLFRQTKRDKRVHGWWK
jgi:hypothetical protein